MGVPGIPAAHLRGTDYRNSNRVIIAEHGCVPKPVLLVCILLHEFNKVAPRACHGPKIGAPFTERVRSSEV